MSIRNSQLSIYDDGTAQMNLRTHPLYFKSLLLRVKLYWSVNAARPARKCLRSHNIDARADRLSVASFAEDAASSVSV